MDRQKILIIFAGAWVSAALLTWLVYAKSSGSKSIKTTPVIAANRDLPAGTRLTKRDLKKLNLADNDLPKTAILDETALLDRALLFPVSENEPITTSKVASLGGAEGLSATISQGKRAVSVPINDVSSAGGLIQPRSHVDVLFTRTGSMREALTTTILQDVIVLSIGKQTEVAQGTDATKTVAKPQNPSATLMVTPEDARKLELAKNEGKIGLSLRNPLDRSTLDDNSAVTAEALDPILAGPPRNYRGGPVPNIRDKRVWNQLTGLEEQPAPPKPKEEKKEPPKPRLIVDVYRGDKHVQEIFQ
jgi:pilus assembly protein CpaB